jgi:hypothetical protein
VELIRRIFSTPGRQAAAWAAVGIAGLGLAALGLLLYDRGGGTGNIQRADAAHTATPTATPTGAVSPSPTLSPSPSPTDTPSPTPSPTARAQTNQNSGGSTNSAPAAPAPAATATPQPVTAGGPYCPNISRDAPPSSVIGLLTSAGSPVPAGASVTLAFDGVAGPSAATVAAGGYRVDYGAAGEECANRVGAAIAVIYNGTVYATGHTVGDSPGLPVVSNIAAP